MHEHPAVVTTRRLGEPDHSALVERDPRAVGVGCEEQQRRQASLRWGIVLSCLAGGFALIQSFGYNDVNPGAIAVLLGATGVGNLAFYAIARNQPK